MTEIIQRITRELKNNSDEKTRESGRRFFREEIRLHGVKAAVVRRIGKEFYREIKGMGKGEIFGLCHELWETGYTEESAIACGWAYNLRKRYEPEDFQVFERWIMDYVSNWAECDTLCNHTVGAFVEMYPGFLSVLKAWGRSANRWARRAAAVSLIIPARHGKFLNDIFEIADILLTDKDDMVRKGYGWMLKAASQAHENEVYDYVMANKDKMPRTALRYAIEKMPEVLRRSAMVK